MQTRRRASPTTDGDASKKRHAPTQYTIRNIPADLDKAIKARAKRLSKSVNQIALEALANVVDRAVKKRSLRDMPGAWSKSEAERFDRFLREQRSIDDELWK
jgi:hypothetical protein